MVILSRTAVVCVYVAAVVGQALLGAAVAGTPSCGDLHGIIEDRTSKLAVARQIINSKKCDVNLRRASNKYTLLHSALVRIATIGFSHPYDKETVGFIRYLISKGADVKIPFPEYVGISGYTPLHWAAFDGNMLLVPVFIQKGANVNAKDQRGFTPLHSAARCDFKISCDDCTPPPNTKKNEPRLWKLGARPVMKYLVGKGANILAKTYDKATVLDIVPAPCKSKPASSCKIYGVNKCSDMCTDAWRAKTWPSGACQKTYFYVKDAMAAARKQRG